MTRFRDAFRGLPSSAARRRSQSASRGLFASLVLLALLGGGAFLWLGRGARASRGGPGQATDLLAQPERASTELVAALETAEPARRARMETPPELAPVARDGAAPVPPPAPGSVLVQLLTEDGSPAADGTRVRLQVLGAGAPRPALNRSWAPAGGVTAKIDSGQARFEGVELGRELELDAAVGLARARASVAGPRSSGESVLVVLRLEPYLARLVFRALDPSGQPVRGDVQLEIRRWSEDRTNSNMGNRTTDDGGRFELELEAALPAGERRELEVRAHPLVGRVDLSQSFPPERIDMGDLVLARAPLLADGRVVDGSGKPLPNVTISCRAALATWRVGAPPSHASTVTDELGEFELYGFVDAPEVVLSALAAGGRAGSIEAALGTRGLEIVLREPESPTPRRRRRQAR